MMKKGLKRMMRKEKIQNCGLVLILMFTIIVSSCTKPYNPTGIKAVTGYLVVEGVINAGNDSTKIRLSRTVTLTADTTIAPVTGATVVIEGSDNSSHTLSGNSVGLYSAKALNLDQSKQYRIDIKTADGKEYRSDYVPVKVTPPIDTIMPVVGNNSLQMALNTHDGTNNTRYYRWSYSETWEFHAKYYSSFETNGDTVLIRPPADQVYYCYDSDSSHNILLGSSAKLANDVISSQPIQFIASTSEKIEIEYSIIVYQYALTNDAYNFWTNLKRNTEQLGSIFDAQPSQLQSNIHCLTNPAEPVVGYMSASTVQSKRVFVQNSALPKSWEATYPYSCELDSILFKKVLFPSGVIFYAEDYYFNYNKGAPKNSYIPIQEIVTPTGAVLGHMGTDAVCGDCTLRGGKLAKPYFWK